MTVRYQSLDRGATVDHEREFLPIRDRRDRSLERSLYFDEDTYGSRSARQSPTSHQPFLGELQHQNSDLQRELGNLKKELELTNQKLGSSMHSIKTFWSPELKKERALRKEESAKYSLINDQLKLLSSENQKQAMLVRQLEEELRMRMRGPSIEMQQQMEVIYQENEHLTREIAILRDTIKELELRIETQKQTLQARDESIKKLLEMLQNKGMGKEEERQMFQQMQAMAQKQLDEFRVEIQRRDQEILAMSAKMKTLEEQHQDYQRHIAVLKESLCAKEEHYNMLQADVDELRSRLDEKNRHIEKKTQQFTQERQRAGSEIAEMREHMDIKDRKINVLQRKMELMEVSKKMHNNVAPQKQNEEIIAQKKQLDEQRRQFEEQRKTVDSKHKQMLEKEKHINEMDQDLRRRKDQMDKLEAQLKKAGGGAAAAGELNKKLSQAEQNYKKAMDEAKQKEGEMERLLQLVQMSQEEQNTKEKTIMELQQALKAAQSKLKSQQQVNAQLEEQRKKEEHSEIQTIEESDEETKDSYISKLMDTVESYEDALKENRNEIGILTTKLERKEDTIKELEVTASDNGKKLEELFGALDEKRIRVLELEEALRESMEIAEQRDMDIAEEDRKRQRVVEKVAKLEQRLVSIQTAQALRCHSCRPTLLKMHSLQSRFGQLVKERKHQLHELADMKREALEAAISEKDAHLALLEMSGIRSAKRAEEVDQLKTDRRRLVERLQLENELSVSLTEDPDDEEFYLADFEMDEETEETC